MTESGIKIDGYYIDVEYDDNDIIRAYIGSNSGIDIWPILNDDFRLKVFKAIFKDKLNK